MKQAGAFKKDGWGSEICEELAPKGSDIVVEGKRGLDGFESTNLDFILRARGIKNLAVCGFLVR